MPPMRGAGHASGNGPDFLLSVLSCALVHIFPHAYQLLFKAAFFPERTIDFYTVLAHARDKNGAFGNCLQG